MAYELQEARELVIRAGLELSESGLIARTWGNISARISDTQFVITPSGRAYEDLTPDQIVITNIEDCSYEGSVKPSSEKWIHADAYKLRPEVNFVIHTHQNYASALSILGDTVLEVPKSSSFEAGSRCSYRRIWPQWFAGAQPECNRSNLRLSLLFCSSHGESRGRMPWNRL